MEAPSAPQSEAKDATSASGAAAPQVETRANAIGSAASRDKQTATVQGEVQPSARNERAFAAFRSIQKYSCFVESPFGLDSLARRKRRGYRAFYRCGKNMGFADEPFPGRLACGRGGFRHGLLVRRTQWRDCANDGWRALGAHLAAGAGRWNWMPNCRIGPASRRAMRCPLRLRRTTGESLPPRTAEKPGIHNSKIPCKKFGQSRSKQ